jgi:hypothetical protein
MRAPEGTGGRRPGTRDGSQYRAAPTSPKSSIHNVHDPTPTAVDQQA